MLSLWLLLRLTNRSANMVNWKDTLARQMAKLKKEGRQVRMAPARINGNRKNHAVDAYAASECDYISILHVYFYNTKDDMNQAQRYFYYYPPSDNYA